MCGIAGIVSFQQDERVDEARLVRMRDVIAHRGPDDAGLWIEGPVGLAHRRLSIIDVGGGHQPMTTEDQGVWGVFNGEIYNHADLRPELEARGHVYRTRTDTETILHLYEELGDKAPERLHGMFAFALWDRSQRRLLLARDRLGIKPLYYACTDRELLFASEIKAILAAGVKAELNESILPEYLATRFVSGEDTFYRGIRKLLPGQTLSWSCSKGFVRRRYWQIPASATRTSTSFQEETADLRRRLVGAVQRHLMSDVPLGIFLSGGIDSSALAGMAATLVKEPLQTFSVGFSEVGANELPYARMVADHLGATHREVMVSPAQYFSVLPRLIWQEDEPIAFTASVPLYYVSALAREHVKVVLTGEGADELFLGYSRYRLARLNGLLGRPYFAVVPRRARARVRGMVETLPGSVRRYAERTFLAQEPDDPSVLFEQFAVFREPLQRTLFTDSTLGSRRDRYGSSVDFDRAANPAERLSRIDLQTYLHELLMKQDQMSMATSIESRVPFLDDEIIEHVVAMPTAFKLRRGRTKAVLREAVRDFVPPPILTRKKMGFPVPIGHWLRSSFRLVVDEFVLGGRTLERGWFEKSALERLVQSHQSGASEHGERLWLLANLEIWQRTFIDGEDVDRVMDPISKAFGRSQSRPVDEPGRALVPEHR
jgi:asparagine synthase (glutamine-hydrolysing)